MPQTKESAKDDFLRARQRADLEKVISSLTGKSAELLSFEDVRRKVRGVRGNRRVLKDVPLDSIVGSVGRYEDFTRDFLPRRDSDRDSVERTVHDRSRCRLRVISGNRRGWRCRGKHTRLPSPLGAFRPRRHRRSQSADSMPDGAQ